MFAFEFMRNAMAVGIMLAIMIPMIGVVMVNRRTSMVGDALSHTSLTGVALGLILSFNPVIGAVIICIVSAFAIEFFRKKFPQYGDMATAVIMSMGLGIAAILSDFAPGGNTFESYLFGSISAVTKQDVLHVGIVFVLVVLASLAFYASLLDLAIDKQLARLAGVKIGVVNSIFTLLTAVTVALACKIVGALLVSSLLVLPVATALIIARSYRQTFLVSVILGIIYMVIGITLSYYFTVRPGGTIVICAIVGMLLIAAYSKIRPVHTKQKLGETID
ncbi:MAG: metal ABC transporter permease [Eubacteriales bacterium]|nr:metal ABC transporter permease [Eubacteriales bacterium]